MNKHRFPDGKMHLVLEEIRLFLKDVIKRHDLSFSETACFFETIIVESWFNNDLDEEQVRDKLKVLFKAFQIFYNESEK